MALRRLPHMVNDVNGGNIITLLGTVGHGGVKGGGKTFSVGFILAK